MRENLQNFFHSKCYNVGITLIILLNCIVLGLETTHFVKDTSHFELAKWLKSLILLV